MKNKNVFMSSSMLICMLFVVKKQLTNLRPPSSTDAELIVTPTGGNIRLTEAACELMDVTAGDYLGVVEGEADGKVQFYLHKGQAGTETESAVGSKLGSATNKMGGSLQFSSANAYQQLGGDPTKSRYFSVKGAKEGEESMVQEHEGVKYFPIEFVSEEEKTERNYKTEEEKQAAAAEAGNDTPSDEVTETKAEKKARLKAESANA